MNGNMVSNLAPGVERWSAGLLGVLALPFLLLGQPSQALGVLAGGAIGVGNFYLVRRSAPLALGLFTGARMKRPLWLVGSLLRYGLIFGSLALLVQQSWVGLGGLFVGLGVLPLMIVVYGLRQSRAEVRKES